MDEMRLPLRSDPWFFKTSRLHRQAGLQLQCPRGRSALFSPHLGVGINSTGTFYRTDDADDNHWLATRSLHDPPDFGDGPFPNIAMSRSMYTWIDVFTRAADVGSATLPALGSVLNNPRPYMLLTRNRIEFRENATRGLTYAVAFCPNDNLLPERQVLAAQWTG